MRIIFVLSVLFGLFAFPKPALADIAPPGEPPGANPVPGSDSTQVRMMDEKVLIEILEDTSSKNLYVSTSTAGQINYPLGLARVTARFLMRNLGSESEFMAVRFPIGADDGGGNMVELLDLTIAVDGKAVPTRRITGEDPLGTSDEAPWVEFDVHFPAHIDVLIEVQYILKAAGELPYIWFDYIFSTGAGWKGTIGNIELTVRFPYKVSYLNYIPGSPNGNVRYTPGGIRCGNDINWVFTNFEPEEKDNFSLTLAAPSVWQAILIEQYNVSVDPKDSEAWGRLGKLYKSLVMSSHGGRGFRNDVLAEDPGVQELYELSDQAYKKAINLVPHDALWHAGYAELLGFYAYHAKFEGVETASISVKALEEIRIALELSPEDEVIQDIAYNLEFYFPQGMNSHDEVYDFPWLTRTPVIKVTAIQTDVSLETPAIELEKDQAIVTPTVPVTQTNPLGPQGGNRLPLCGSVLLISAILFGEGRLKYPKRG